MTDLDHNHPANRSAVKSDEEWHVVLWFIDAEKAGLVQSWSYEPEPFVLFKPAKYTETKHLKTKTKRVDRCLHRGTSYTPDFRFQLTAYGLGILGQSFKESIITSPLMPIYIDVKGAYNKHDQPRYFSVIQKAVFHIHGIWVKRIVPFYMLNKRTPRGLFFDTYAPEEATRTLVKHEINNCGKHCVQIAEFIQINAQLF